MIDHLVTFLTHVAQAENLDTFSDNCSATKTSIVVQFYFVFFLILLNLFLSPDLSFPVASQILRMAKCPVPVEKDTLDVIPKGLTLGSAVKFGVLFLSL